MNQKIKILFLAAVCMGLTRPLLVRAQTSVEPKEDLLVRLNTSLSSASGYEYGKSWESLTDIDAIMQTVLNTPELKKPVEKQFLAFLQSDATLAGKQFICRKLSLVGSKASVGILSGMLSDERTFDMALYALTRIPSPTVDTVLRNKISGMKNRMRIGLVNTLGYRRDPKSVKILSGLIHEDAETAEAALSALGHIGNTEAFAALSRAMGSLPDERQVMAMHGCLKCADQMARDGNGIQAKAVYKEYLIPDGVRAAALTGIINADLDRADVIILKTLQGGDRQLKSIAIRHLSRLPKINFLDKIAEELPRLERVHQIQLLAALAEKGDRSILPAIVEAARSEDPDVCTAAVQALAFLGDASTVGMLARMAAVEGTTGEAARESLYRMHGENVDEEILKMLADAEPAVKVELLKCAGERAMEPAGGTILAYTADPEGRVREQAIKTLGLIAEPDHLPDLILILNEAKNEKERLEAEKSVIAVAHRIQDKDNQAKDILAALPSVRSIEARSSMLHVLGRIGDVHALPEIRKELLSPNLNIRKAGVRALSDWPTGEPMHDLFEVAGTSRQEPLKILALRGAIQLIRIDKNHSDDEKVPLFQKAFDLSTGSDEKRQALAGLSDLRTMKALEPASRFLDDPALKQEAQAAVVKIADRIWRTHPQETLPYLNKILEGTDDEEVRERAQKLIDAIHADLK
jgi:HEAT repeat protein